MRARIGVVARGARRKQISRGFHVFSSWHCAYIIGNEHRPAANSSARLKEALWAS
jgi:hypothetical protein